MQVRARGNGSSGCRQAGWIWPSLAKESGPWLPMPGGTQPHTASLTYLLQDEVVCMEESFCSLMSSAPVLAGAAEGEVSHQLPHHHSLPALMLEHWGLHTA